MFLVFDKNDNINYYGLSIEVDYDQFLAYHGVTGVVFNTVYCLFGSYKSYEKGQLFSSVIPSLNSLPVVQVFLAVFGYFLVECLV